MSTGRIFAEDWRDCLREQYKYVVQHQDTRTEATLKDVMYEAVFTDEDLSTLRMEATIRADEMPEDYVPEEIMASHAGVEVPAEPVSEIELEAEVEDNALATYDELLEEAEEAGGDLDDMPVDDEDPEDDDSVQQLSLF